MCLGLSEEVSNAKILPLILYSDQFVVTRRRASQVLYWSFGIKPNLLSPFYRLKNNN